MSDLILDDENNPGKMLQNFFMDIYPYEQIAFGRKIDFDLRADGEFEKLLYTSNINYLVRRFITTAKYFYRKYPLKDYGEERYKTELRNFIIDFTGYKTKANDLVRLLVWCVLNSEKNFTKKIKKQIETTDRERKCYICGEEYSEDNYGALTIDHIWPKAMGGGGEISNLRGAHKICNNEYKKDYIDSSDFHYEEISLVHISSTEYYKSRNNNYEVAVFSKTNFCCSVCGKEAQQIGKLYIGRKDPNDSFHFLNLQAYCFLHLPVYDKQIETNELSDQIDGEKHYDDHSQELFWL